MNAKVSMQVRCEYGSTSKYEYIVIPCAPFQEELWQSIWNYIDGEAYEHDMIDMMNMIDMYEHDKYDKHDDMTDMDMMIDMNIIC